MRVIQLTRLAHHTLIEPRHNLVRVCVIHGPHCPNDRAETSKLYGSGEMDDLIWTLLITYSGVTRREVCKLCMLQVIAYDMFNLEQAITQCKPGCKWMLSVWDPVTREVNKIVVAEALHKIDGVGVLTLNADQECDRPDTL